MRIRGVEISLGHGQAPGSIVIRLTNRQTVTHLVPTISDSFDSVIEAITGVEIEGLEIAELRVSEDVFSALDQELGGTVTRIIPSEPLSFLGVRIHEDASVGDDRFGASHFGQDRFYVPVSSALTREGALAHVRQQYIAQYSTDPDDVYVHPNWFHGFQEAAANAATADRMRQASEAIAAQPRRGGSRFAPMATRAEPELNVSYDFEIEDEDDDDGELICRLKIRKKFTSSERIPVDRDEGDAANARKRLRLECFRRLQAWVREEFERHKRDFPSANENEGPTDPEFAISFSDVSNGIGQDGEPPF